MSEASNGTKHDRPTSDSDDRASSPREKVREALRRIDTDFVEEGARDVGEEDVEEIVERADAIKQRFTKEGPLGRFIEDGELMLSLVRDYWRRRYRRVPVWTIGAVAFTLLYILNPMDLVPDALPGVGLIDDAALLSVALLLVEQDLYEYRAWRRALDDSEDAGPDPSLPEEDTPSAAADPS